MKKLLLALFVFMLLGISVMASTETKVNVVSCETDIKISKYDNDTQIVLGIKDENGNEFTNVYLKQQIRKSEKGYSYILEGSNCIYLDDTEYKQVKDNQNATFWIWFIFLLFICIGLLWWQLR